MLQQEEIVMKKLEITMLLVLLCLLAGCTPKSRSFHACCSENQRKFLDESQEELPIALVYHYNDNILGRYETTEEEIISGVLQALRDTTVVSRAFGGSSDSRILEFKTADGDACLFWFNEKRFHGADKKNYVLTGDELIWELVQEIQEAYPEYRDAMK